MYSRYVLALDNNVICCFATFNEARSFVEQYTYHHHVHLYTLYDKIIKIYLPLHTRLNYSYIEEEINWSKEGF